MAGLCPPCSAKLILLDAHQYADKLKIGEATKLGGNERRNDML